MKLRKNRLNVEGREEDFPSVSCVILCEEWVSQRLYSKLRICISWEAFCCMKQNVMLAVVKNNTTFEALFRGCTGVALIARLNLNIWKWGISHWFQNVSLHVLVQYCATAKKLELLWWGWFFWFLVVLYITSDLFFFCYLWYETVSDRISYLYCCLNSLIWSICRDLRQVLGNQGNFPFVNCLKFRSR